MQANSASDIWGQALESLQDQVAKSIYQTWLKDTAGLSYQDDRIVVEVPSTLARERLDRDLKPLIRKTLSTITGHATEVQFQTHSEEEESQPAPLPLTLPRPQFNPKYTFASFIVGNSNRLAHAAALSVAERPGVGYNPLFLYGGVGLGKTHLLHAIGHTLLQPKLRVIYVTAEQFTNEFIAGIRDKRVEHFDNKFRGADVLLIDDIQFIAGKQETQEKLFHTLNDLHNANRQIVLSSDRPPRALSLLEERLRSRFEWGLIADIQPPDLETRVAILQAKAQEHHVNFTPDVMYFIAHQIQSNIRELEGALNRIAAYAILTHSLPTTELARQIMGQMTGLDFKRSLTPGTIIAAVADFYKLDPETLQGKRRDRPIALARQVAMYLIREETQCAWTEIGRELGGKDHSTVVHGYKKIAADVEANYALRREVLQIKERLYSEQA